MTDQPSYQTQVDNCDDMDNHGDTIGEQAGRELRRCAYLVLQHVSCEFHAGVLTLRGRLPSYHLKQVAQMAVSAIDGVQCINNQIEVEGVEPATQGQDGTGSDQ